MEEHIKTMDSHCHCKKCGGYTTFTILAEFGLSSYDGTKKHNVGCKVCGYSFQVSLCFQGDKIEIRYF